MKIALEQLVMLGSLLEKLKNFTSSAVATGDEISKAKNIRDLLKAQKISYDSTTGIEPNQLYAIKHRGSLCFAQRSKYNNNNPYYDIYLPKDPEKLNKYLEGKLGSFLMGTIEEGVKNEIVNNYTTKIRLFKDTNKDPEVSYSSDISNHRKGINLKNINGKIAIEVNDTVKQTRHTKTYNTIDLDEQQELFNAAKKIKNALENKNLDFSSDKVYKIDFQDEGWYVKKLGDSFDLYLPKYDNPKDAAREYESCSQIIIDTDGNCTGGVYSTDNRARKVIEDWYNDDYVQLSDDDINAEVEIDIEPSENTAEEAFKRLISSDYDNDDDIHRDLDLIFPQKGQPYNALKFSFNNINNPSFKARAHLLAYFHPDMDVNLKKFHGQKYINHLNKIDAMNSSKDEEKFLNITCIINAYMLGRGPKPEDNKDPEPLINNNTTNPPQKNPPPKRDDDPFREAFERLIFSDYIDSTSDSNIDSDQLQKDLACISSLENQGKLNVAYCEKYERQDLSNYQRTRLELLQCCCPDIDDDTKNQLKDNTEQFIDAIDEDNCSDDETRFLNITNHIKDTMKDRLQEKGRSNQRPQDRGFIWILSASIAIIISSLVAVTNVNISSKLSKLLRKYFLKETQPKVNPPSPIPSSTPIPEQADVDTNNQYKIPKSPTFEREPFVDAPTNQTREVQPGPNNENINVNPGTETTIIPDNPVSNEKLHNELIGIVNDLDHMQAIKNGGGYKYYQFMNNELTDDQIKTWCKQVNAGKYHQLQAEYANDPDGLMQAIEDKIVRPHGEESMNYLNEIVDAVNAVNKNAGKPVYEKITLDNLANNRHGDDKLEFFKRLDGLVTGNDQKAVASPKTFYQGFRDNDEFKNFITPTSSANNVNTNIKQVSYDGSASSTESPNNKSMEAVLNEHMNDPRVVNDWDQTQITNLSDSKVVKVNHITTEPTEPLPMPEDPVTQSVPEPEFFGNALKCIGNVMAGVSVLCAGVGLANNWKKHGGHIGKMCKDVETWRYTAIGGFGGLSLLGHANPYSSFICIGLSIACLFKGDAVKESQQALNKIQENQAKIREKGTIFTGPRLFLSTLNETRAGFVLIAAQCAASVKEFFGFQKHDIALIQDDDGDEKTQNNQYTQQDEALVAQKLAMQQASRC
jgi:hypothetical protein